MKKSDTEESAGKPARTEIADENVTQQQNVNLESITPGVITYTAPVTLGYDTTYKTRLTGKLKVAEIVQDIVVVMVARLESYPGSYVDVFINYLLALGASGICISGLIFFLNSSGIIDLHLKAYKSFWIGLEFSYCILWLVQFLVIPSLILGFTYSVEDYDETLHPDGSYEKNLIFMVVIAYFSSIVYAWDIWATFKVLRKHLKKSNTSLMLNPTTSIVS